MHVLVDASILKPGLGGIATYAEGIVRSLSLLDGVRVTVATSCPERFAGLDGIEVVALSPAVRGFGRRFAWRELRLRSIARAAGADVLLATTVELPLRDVALPSLVIVHDVGPLAAPELYGRARRARFAALLGPVLRRAGRVACVSAATRAALVDAVPDLVAPLAVVREGPRVAGLLPWSPAPEPYVLYVGPLLRHKNVDTLMRAFAEPSLQGVALRIAGAASSAERSRLDARAQDLGAVVEHAGFVDHARLARLYAGAHAVALPSLHEGFGLPLLEALAAGAPAVASAIPAHIEIAGAAAVLVDRATDPRAWAQALSACVRDPRAARSRVEAAASERVAHYTWEGAAADVHAELLALATGRVPI